ncbi:isoprenoid synthase domain-containing protein [Microdochium trichocladiopsis]|uniref:Isoprenoid synthase domain-containing protein n=1 Tax=Microdochium trichocladiopsis TaxID=1682393 RepID=A0A9P8YF65_9PEZI|nr:isoprenoid synthase domain-containing protein [Microdochium trichocladiopsis]KAH7035868.1 isoprenoid synthase domain-containing protein [Microdochium trichocladiopsis]
MDSCLAPVTGFWRRWWTKPGRLFRRTTTTRSVFDQLRGKTLLIPDLKPIYSRWESGLNPGYERLSNLIDEAIDDYVVDEKQRLKTRAINLAWFVSATYPNAGWEQLKTMGLLALMLFVFDDAIDKEIEPGKVDFASDFEAASVFREECISYARAQLGVSPDTKSVPPPPEFAGFGAFTELLLATCPPGQIDMTKLADRVQHFIEAHATEQKHRLSGRLASVQEYWKFRHGVGAVYVFCAVHPYMANVSLPDELVWSPEVEIMSLETSTQPIICNDLYSLKKEIDEETPANLIPIMLASTDMSLEEIIADLVGQMDASAKRFDDAVNALRVKAQKYDQATQENLEHFIKTFESFQTGCFRFYMKSRRFGIKQYEQADGSFLIPL